MRLVLWALLILPVYAPLYLLTPHLEGWWWLPCVSAALAALAVLLLLRTEFFDRAAAAIAPRAPLLLALAVVSYATVATLVARARLAGFGDCATLGLFGQSCWTLLHGHPFSNTVETMDGSLGSHLAVRFSPALLLLAPLYALLPDPLTLAALQALAVGLAIVPLYRLLERDLGEPAAAVLAVALLAVPSVGGAGLHDFRDAAFLPALLLAVCWALEYRRHVLLAIAAVAALGVREDAALALVMLGVYSLLRARGWRVSLGLAALGAAWVVAVVPLATPFFWTPGLEAGPPRLFADPLGHWGATPFEAARAMAASPGPLEQTLGSGEIARYLHALLSPTLVIPPLFDPVWIAGLPGLALNLFSRLPATRDAGAQDSIVPATFFMLAAALVVVRASWHAPLVRRSAFALALGVVVLAGALPALPLAARRSEPPRPPAGPARAVVRRIPPAVPVYAPLALYPALCNRESFGCWESLREDAAGWSMRGRYRYFVLWPAEDPAAEPRDRALADSLATDPRFEPDSTYAPLLLYRRR
jgi:hypothetical protein